MQSFEILEAYSSGKKEEQATGCNIAARPTDAKLLYTQGFARNVNTTLGMMEILEKKLLRDNGANLLCGFVFQKFITSLDCPL